MIDFNEPAYHWWERDGIVKVARISAAVNEDERIQFDIVEGESTDEGVVTLIQGSESGLWQDQKGRFGYHEAAVSRSKVGVVMTGNWHCDGDWGGFVAVIPPELFGK